MGKHALIIFFILCSFGIVLPAFGQNNIKKNASIAYTLGPPTFTPTLASSTEVAIDSSTGKIYQWHRTTSAWLQLGQGIDVISGSIPPAYTPARNQSIFAINAVDSLYHYRSGAWRHLNAGGGGATVDGHVVMEGNTPRAQRDSLEFRSNSVIAFSATNNSTRTIIEGTIQAGGVGAAEIAADAVGNSELAANAVDSTNVINGGLSVLDLGQHGASSGHVLKWNGAQWAPGPVVVPDGDKGDVDVTSSGTVWTVDTSAITTIKIAANAVDSTKIVNGGVSVLDLGQHGAISGNVLKWNGTQWAPGTDNNSGGTVTGSGTDTYVAYWNGASSLTGEAAFAYNATTDALSIGASNPVSVTGSGITTAQAFTIGGSSSTLTLSGTGSGGLISLNTTGLSASGAVAIGGTTGSGSTETAAFGITKGQTITSGSNPRSMMKISGPMGNTGGSTGILRGIWIVPSALNTVVDYRGLDLDFNDAAARGVYQSGALVRNFFAGKTTFGATTEPVATVDITGTLRLSDLTATPTRIGGYDADGDAGQFTLGAGLSISSGTLNTDIDGGGAAGQVAYFTDAETLAGENALFWDAANDRLGINNASPAKRLDFITSSAADGMRISSDGTINQVPGSIEFVGTATGPYTQRGYIFLNPYSGGGGLLPDGHTLVFRLARDGGSTYDAMGLSNSEALFNRSGSFTLANNTAELRLAPNSNNQIRLYHTALILGSAHGTLDTTSRLRVVGRTLTSATYSATFRDQGNALILAVRDDKRVGINTSTIDAALTVVANGATSSTYGLIVTPSGGTTSTASIVVRDDNRVGIRTNAPQAPLNVVGTGTTSSTTALLVEGSGGQDNLNVRDDGVNIGQGFAMASSAPSISFGAAAGTGPANDLCSGGANGFFLAFTTGTSPGSNAAIFTATLPKSYPNGVVATWSCGDTDCLDEAPDIYISGTGNNSVTISTRSTLTASTAYLIYVTCFGY